MARDWGDPDVVARNISPATAKSFNEGRDSDDMEGSITLSAMRKTALKKIAALVVAAGFLAWPGLHAQGPLPDFRELQWRNIGPHRASRTKALDGVPGQPHTFYIGVVNGGVWKTTDAGRSWIPVFDQQPTGSIGALAVAPSDPTVIYLGTGEAPQRPALANGDRMYKCTA